MATRRNALGRGLGALLPSAPPAAGTKASAESPDSTTPKQADELAIDRIDPNPEQPRRHFDEAELDLLASSIQRHGVLQPVVVRRAAGERFELVVGERRWRAAQRAGRPTIPAVVADVEPRDLLELALVENVQRHDLNPIELALAFRALTQGGATQDQVGERVGLDRSTVSNHLRLLELPRDVQEDVEEGRITVGHAKALLQVHNTERRRHLHDQVLRQNLSVREAEALARKMGGPSRRTRHPKPAEDSDPHVQALVAALREHLQTKVRITGGGKRGRIELDYFSIEDLNRLSRAILEEE